MRSTRRSGNWCPGRSLRALTEVREVTKKWIEEYNEERPHDVLNHLTSWQYLEQYNRLENSNLRRH